MIPKSERMLWFLVYRYSSSTIIQPGKGRNAKSITRRGFKYSGATQPRKDRLCPAIIRTQHDLTSSNRHDAPASYKDLRCLPGNYRPQQSYPDQAKAPAQKLIISQPLVLRCPISPLQVMERSCSTETMLPQQHLSHFMQMKQPANPSLKLPWSSSMAGQ